MWQVVHVRELLLKSPKFPLQLGVLASVSAPSSRSVAE